MEATGEETEAAKNAKSEVEIIRESLGDDFVIKDSISFDEHEWIDLDLPSGTLWATCNVGAKVPESHGDYFAWGETKPKSIYSWSTYAFCNSKANRLTKYCTNSNYGDNGFTDSLTELLPEDDAATANWGEPWQTPDPAQLAGLACYELPQRQQHLHATMRL